MDVAFNQFGHGRLSLKRTHIYKASALFLLHTIYPNGERIFDFESCDKNRIATLEN